MNELLLLGSVGLIYGMVLLSYRLFGKVGLYAMTVIATILANIEVLILVDGFGMEQTLGNVMFASTYLITDILSENEGKKSASLAVWVGVFTSAAMVLFTQYWFLYAPSANDWAAEPVRRIFATTPRMMLASFVGYVVSQRFDVWLYHAWWKFSTRLTGNSEKMLWLRNNGSTMISQLLNTVLFTLVAFAGWYDGKTLFGIMQSSYVIFLVTSLLDTPMLYLARYMKKRGWVADS